MKLPIANRARYAVYVVCAVVAVAALASVTIYVTGLPSSQPPPAGTFITVNGINVPLRHFEDLMNVNAMYDSFQEETLEEIRQIAADMLEPTLVQTHLEFRALTERHGIETAILGDLIMEYARHSQARKAGVAIDEAAIADVIASSKASLAEYEQTRTANPDTEMDTTEKIAVAEYDYYVATYGEDGYWDEFLTDRFRRRWGVLEWQNNEVADRIERGVQAKNDRGIYLLDIELETLDDAKVEVVDASALGTTTVAAAKAYMRESLSLTHDTK